MSGSIELRQSHCQCRLKGDCINRGFYASDTTASRDWMHDLLKRAIHRRPAGPATRRRSSRSRDWGGSSRHVWRVRRVADPEGKQNCKQGNDHDAYLFHGCPPASNRMPARQETRSDSRNKVFSCCRDPFLRAPILFRRRRPEPTMFDCILDADCASFKPIIRDGHSARAIIALPPPQTFPVTQNAPLVSHRCFPPLSYASSP